MLAVRNQQLEIVKYLMELGGDFKANPNEKNFKGQSASSVLTTIKDEQVKIVL